MKVSRIIFLVSLCAVVMVLTTGYYRRVPIKFIQDLTYAPITCHPFYSGCLNIFALDYDCIGSGGNGPQYTGRVRVLRYDIFRLDDDGDGWAC